MDHACDDGKGWRTLLSLIRRNPSSHLLHSDRIMGIEKLHKDFSPDRPISDCHNHKSRLPIDSLPSSPRRMKDARWLCGPGLVTHALSLSRGKFISSWIDVDVIFCPKRNPTFRSERHRGCRRNPILVLLSDLSQLWIQMSLAGTRSHGPSLQFSSINAPKKISQKLTNCRAPLRLQHNLFPV